MRNDYTEVANRLFNSVLPYAQTFEQYSYTSHKSLNSKINAGTVVNIEDVNSFEIVFCSDNFKVYVSYNDGITDTHNMDTLIIRIHEEFDPQYVDNTKYLVLRLAEKDDGTNMIFDLKMHGSDVTNIATTLDGIVNMFATKYKMSEKEGSCDTTK